MVGAKRIPVQQGLNMWLRADMETAPDGTNVPFMRDFSGAENHMIQATAAQRPVYCKYGGVDGLPFYSFDQTTQRIVTCANYQTNLRSFSVLWVGDTQTIDGSKYLLRVGTLSLVLMVQNGFVNLYTGATIVASRPFSGRRFACVITADASGCRVYVDDVSSVTSTSALAASTISGLSLGDSGGVYTGRFYEVAAYNRSLSFPEVSALLAYAKYYYGTGISQQTPTGRLVLDGDSTVYGLGTTRNRNAVYYINPAKDWYTYNFGVSGQTITTMSTDQSEVNALAAAGNWLFFEAGYNDLSGAATGATTEGRISTYLNAAITAGFPKSQIILMTLSTSGTPTERDNLNTLLRSNYTGYAGWLVDQAADANLGVTAGSGFKDISNFFDGVHMNDKGLALKAALIRSTIGVSLPF